MSLWLVAYIAIAFVVGGWIYDEDMVRYNDITPRVLWAWVWPVYLLVGVGKWLRQKVR